MKTQSAKAKGRRLQQEVARRIQERFNLPATDVKSLPMGSQGCDVWLSAFAHSKLPFSIECKNVERLNVGQAFKQTVSNTVWECSYPVLVHSRNRSEVLATLRFDDLLSLVRGSDGKA